MEKEIKKTSDTEDVYACRAGEDNYAKITIENKTSEPIAGTCIFAACKTDNFVNIQPGATWTGPYRGACLLTSIHVSIGGTQQAESYLSSGTGYASFRVDKNDLGQYAVLHND